MIHKELLKTLSHNAKYDNKFNKELESLFEYLEKKMGEEFNKYCGEYYENNSSRLTIDKREKRHISENICKKYNNQAEKERAKKEELEKEMMRRLEGIENIGIDIYSLRKRLVESNEIIVTIFENGNCVKRQDPDGIHIILPKKKTLKYDALSNKLECVDPSIAESMDDSSPFSLFFFDSMGVKRDYKCNYSINRSPSLYSYLSSLNNT